MPTILRRGPYRFFFYSSDVVEPRHVHVERDDNVAKFWLEPVRLQAAGGFSRVEITRIGAIVEENHQRLIEVWNGYFGG